MFLFPGGKDGRRVGLTTLPPSCADCLEILASLELNLNFLDNFFEKSSNIKFQHTMKEKLSSGMTHGNLISTSVSEEPNASIFGTEYTRQHVLPKLWYPSNKLQAITCKKKKTFLTHTRPSQAKAVPQHWVYTMLQAETAS